MSAPVQMTKHTLNALKGWPNPAAVDFHTEYDASLADVIVRSGTVVHLNDAGKYELGVGNAQVMPMFTFNNSNDPDVVNDGGDPATERGIWIAISPTGQAMALVAVGAYELVSTEFVDDTYLPNDHLTSPVVGVDAGLLMKGTSGTNTICGLVSRGVVDNGYGEEALAFWPWYVGGNGA